MVRCAEEAEAALAAAGFFDDEVLVERYVSGRELRAVVIELGDEFLTPAFIEYPTSMSRPVGTVQGKLERGEGAMRQSRRADAQPICPAIVEPDLASRLSDSARRAHRALGARDYSLFDFRIDAEIGEPNLLKAGLFWPFSSLSAITKMLRADGEDAEELILQLWRAAAGRSSSLPIRP